AYYDQSNPKIIEYQDVYIKCSEAPFDKYIIKKLSQYSNDSHYLFIPKSYINSIDSSYVHKTVDHDIDPSAPLEPIEEKLGIKFNHYADVELKAPTNS